MQKLLAGLLACALLFGSACAEAGDFRAGTNVARLGGSVFFTIDEGETDALVRVDSVPMLAVRAEELGPVLTHDGALYYLEKREGTWSLMRRGETTMPETIYTFGAGKDVSALGEYGEELFVLVDGQLHVIYLKRRICIMLADARMSEYAMDGAYAYFISASDIVSYEVPAAVGVVSANAGCLYRLNLSTGNTSLVIKAGAEDLKYRAGKLYFHNLSDAYLLGEHTVAGKLWAFDLTTETLARVLDDYDWAYYVSAAGLLVHREGEVFLMGADATISTVCETGPRMEVFFSDDAAYIYDPDEMTFTAYPISATE